MDTFWLAAPLNAATLLRCAGKYNFKFLSIFCAPLITFFGDQNLRREKKCNLNLCIGLTSFEVLVCRMGELYWQVELDYTLRLPKVPKPTFDVNNFLKALTTIFNWIDKYFASFIFCWSHKYFKTGWTNILCPTNLKIFVQPVSNCLDKTSWRPIFWIFQNWLDKYFVTFLCRSPTGWNH